MRHVLLAFVVLLICAAGARGALAVGLTGAGPVTFDTLPPASEWAGRAIPGSSSSFSTFDALNAAIQTNSVGIITNVLVIDPGGSPLPHTQPAWSSAYHSVFTAPAGTAAAMIVCTLANDFAELHYIWIGYDIVIPTSSFIGAEEIPGHQVYFSLSGAPNTWQLVPELSGLATPGSKGAVLNLGIWPAGALLYLLWVQDNSARSPETVYLMDNFQATPDGPPMPPCITLQPTNTTVVENNAASLSSTAGCTSSPVFYQWFKQGQPVTGANSPTLALPRAGLSDAGEYYLVATNLGGPAQSQPAILSVLPDDGRPSVLAAYRADNADPNADTIAVMYSERVETNTGTLPGNYIVQNSGDANDMPPILDVSMSGESNVVLRVGNLAAAARYTIQISGVTDDSAAYNPLSPNPATLFVQTFASPVIPASQPWKYLEASNNAAPAGWQMRGFDDSAWPTAPGAFGLPLDEVVPAPFTMQSIIRTPDIGGPITTLFRTIFQNPNINPAPVLQLSGVFDDGALVYLNGQEIWRVRLPAGPIAPFTLATNAPESAPGHPLDGPVYIYASGLLRSGDNTLAVELHQATPLSGDAVMGLALAISQNNIVVDCFPRLNIVHTNNDVVAVHWTCGGTLQVSTNVTPSATWRDIVTASNNFTTNFNGTALFFRIR